MKPAFRLPLIAAALALGVAAAAAATSTKDIVIERVAAPASPGNVTGPTGDAMAISVLLESPDGSLTPRSVEAPFRTGDRFRVKLVASRDARVSLYNTNPQGVTGSQPVWQGELKLGQETISPRLRLDGSSGVDQLHVVMEPPQSTGVVEWLARWLRGGDGKDIRVDVQNTASASYLVNTAGQEGLVSTVRFVHMPR